MPLMRELRAAVQEARGACKRLHDGKYKGADGKLLPSLLEVNIRGRALCMENNAKRLRVNIGDSLELMSWTGSWRSSGGAHRSCPLNQFVSHLRNHRPWTIRQLPRPGGERGKRRRP